jgi:transcription elongation factor GreA
VGEHAIAAWGKRVRPFRAKVSLTGNDDRPTGLAHGARLPAPARRDDAAEQGADHRHDQHERLLALQLGLAARPLSHVYRDLVNPKAGAHETHQSLHLRRTALVRLREEWQRLGIRGVHPARRIGKPLPERHRERASKKCRSEPAGVVRLVAIWLVALAGDESGPDRHVAGVLADERHEANELGDRVLTVGIDPTGQPVAALGGEAPAGGDTGLEPAVLRKAEHLRTTLARHLGGAVGGAVVDDEEISFRKLGGELRQDRGEVLLLVPGGDEDKQVVRRRHARDGSRPRYPLLVASERKEQLTQAQRAKLEQELAELEGPRRKEMVQAIKVARSFGDLSENFEYHAAKNEQGLLERRITIMRARLQNSVAVEAPTQAGEDTVSVGSKVQIENEEGETIDLEISSVGGVSPDSPLGDALLGGKVGDTVKVKAPRGDWQARIVSVGR